MFLYSFFFCSFTNLSLYQAISSFILLLVCLVYFDILSCKAAEICMYNEMNKTNCKP